MIFDSHAHYDDDAFDPDRDELLARLPSEGVGYIMNVGCDIETSLFAQRMSEQYGYIYCGAGIHPHNAADVPPDYLVRIRELLSHDKARVLGEIGLDYHYPDPPRDVQKVVFEAQLRLAVELGVPVCIHMREAAEDTLRLLRQYRPQGVVHCFSGSRETAAQVVALGLYVGFTGVVTFPNARRAHEALREVPPDRLLIETDAPYLAPVPLRGKRCDSGMLVHTAAKIAELLGREAQEIVRETSENAKRLFGIG